MRMDLKRLFLITFIFGVMVVLYWRISSLEQLHDSDMRELYSKVLSVESRFLKSLVGETDQKKLDEARNRLKKLPGGIYVTELSVRVLNEAKTRTVKKSFTLYHIKESVGKNPTAYDINIGLAFSGMASIPVFYMDYDQDGNIDLDIMQEFVELLPAGRLLAKAVDIVTAQAVYDTFLVNTAHSKYYSSSEIGDGTGKWGQELWIFVNSTSEQLSSWIGSRVDSSGNPKVVIDGQQVTDLESF